MIRRASMAAACWLAGCSVQTRAEPPSEPGSVPPERPSPASLDLRLADRQLSLSSSDGFVCHPRTSRFDAAFDFDDGAGALRFRLTPVGDGTYRVASAFDASVGYVLRDAEFIVALDPATRMATLEFTGLVEREPTAMHTGVGCRSMKGVEISPVRGRVAGVLPPCPERS